MNGPEPWCSKTAARSPPIWSSLPPGFDPTAIPSGILLGHAALSAAVKMAVETKQDFSDLLLNHPRAADVLERLAEQSV